MIDTSQKQSREIQKEMSIDLIAMYRQAKEDMIKILNKSEREKWTIEKLIKELEDQV